ncbi:rhodanese-like domain-containing protein [Exiguobacterium sp. SL14]|nr:rhodanese-like domain-containing protein [Exiguobacterium sp. SL14]MCY1692393.1 rhodanese-like domain-containing protein [Exiguobacterium sp. SL14]
MKQMTTDQLQQTLTESTIQLIDVRESHEYESGHIAEAKNVPLSELTERTDELDASRPVHIICLSGGRDECGDVLGASWIRCNEYQRRHDELRRNNRLIH